MIPEADHPEAAPVPARPLTPEKPCVVCRTPIAAEARKCVTCGSYQSFVSRIMAGLDLQALVALVPVMTLAFVFLKDQVVSHESNLQATLLECSSDEARLFVSNAGDRAAVVKSADFCVENAGTRNAWMPLSLTDRSLEGLLVGPGDSQLLVLRRPLTGPVRPPLIASNQRGPDCRLYLRVDTVAFDHHPTPRIASCECPG